MAGRFISIKEASNILNVAEGEVTYYMLNSDWSNKEVLEQDSFPESLVLDADIDRNPGQDEPVNKILAISGRSGDSLDLSEHDFLNCAGQLCDRLRNFLSTNAMMNAAAIVLQTNNVVRLPIFFLLVRECINNWLDEVAPAENVSACEWYRKNHDSGDAKGAPTNGDKILYNIARQLSFGDFYSSLEQETVKQNAVIAGRVFARLNRQVHFNKETLVFDKESVISSASETLRDYIFMLDGRRRVGLEFGRMFSSSRVVDIERLVYHRMKIRAESMQYDITGDWFIESMIAGSYKKGVGIEIKGCAKLTPSGNSAHSGHDHRFEITVGFPWDSTTPPFEDGFGTFTHKDYFVHPDRPSANLSESIFSYLNSRRARRDDFEPLTKVTRPIVEGFDVPFSP